MLLLPRNPGHAAQPQIAPGFEPKKRSLLLVISLATSLCSFSGGACPQPATPQPADHNQPRAPRSQTTREREGIFTLSQHKRETDEAHTMPTRKNRREAETIWSRRVRPKCSSSSADADAPQSPRAAGPDSDSDSKVPGHVVSLPHHIVLDIFSFLETREIVRTRQVAQAFKRDAPSLIENLHFTSRQSLPAATQVDLFTRVTEVSLDGGKDLVDKAAMSFSGCASLSRLRVSGSSSHSTLLQQELLSDDATAKICGLPLTDLDMRGVRIEIPTGGLAKPAWLNLERLVMRDSCLNDSSVANMFASMPKGPLPLRHLDLSRNFFGELESMRPLSEALASFPELESLKLTSDRITSAGAKFVLGALLGGACPKLSLLDMSLNFLDDAVVDFLADGVGRQGHGLLSLEELCIGGRFTPEEGVTTFDSLGRAVAAGGLPLLSLLHLQGDVGPPQVSRFLRRLRTGACPNLSVLKVERSTQFLPEEDDSTEDAVESMWELLMCPHVPSLEEVHVLGMGLGKGMERAEEERTEFYRASDASSFHRLALAGSERGVVIYV